MPGMCPFCICNKLPDDASAAGPWTTFYQQGSNTTRHCVTNIRDVGVGDSEFKKNNRVLERNTQTLKAQL